MARKSKPKADFSELAAFAAATTKDLTCLTAEGHCPKCGSEEVYAGTAEHGLVENENTVFGCHKCDWAVDNRPAPAKAPKAKRPSKDGVVLVFSKEFKPRTDNVGDGTKGRFAQIHNWEALKAAFQASEDGQITYAEAVAAVEAAGKTGGYEGTCNARGFVQGRVRNGHVVVA